MRIRVVDQFLRVPLPLLVLGAVEGVLLFASLYLGALIRFDFRFSDIVTDLGELQPRAAVFAAVMLTTLLSLGLYSSRQRARVLGMLLRVAAAILAGAVAVTLVFYIFPNLYTGRGVLALSVLIGSVAVITTRVVFARLVDQDFFKRRVLVYGAGRQAESIAKLRRRSDQRGFRVVGYVAPPGTTCSVPESAVVKVEGDLRSFVRKNGIDEIVIALDDRRRAFPIKELLDCRLDGVDVIDIVSFLEREIGKVRLDVLNPAWLIFSDGFRKDALRNFTGRVLDVTAALVLFAVAWPFMLLTVIAIMIEDGPRAPILYRQVRVGLHGKHFEVLKFRSMRVDAEKGGRPQWARKGDSRVTRVGAIIRKTRIDELPQILNVLRGDMRLVGPRPERPEFVEELSQKIPYYSHRHFVKPGLTGWAQLCYPYGASEEDAAEKLQYDLYYLKNQSLMLDITILLQTVEVILFGKGSR